MCNPGNIPYPSDGKQVPCPCCGGAGAERILTRIPPDLSSGQIAEILTDCAIFAFVALDAEGPGTAVIGIVLCDGGRLQSFTSRPAAHWAPRRNVTLNLSSWQALGSCPSAELKKVSGRFYARLRTPFRPRRIFWALGASRETASSLTQPTKGARYDPSAPPGSRTRCSRISS